MIARLYRKKPWILVVAAFILLIGAWSTLIVIAVRNQPESVEPERKAERTERKSEGTNPDLTD